MFMNSLRLFLKGKLFREPAAVFQQWLIGFVLTLAIIAIIGVVLSPLVGIVIGSLIGGALQPYLFRDLKYA